MGILLPTHSGHFTAFDPHTQKCIKHSGCVVPLQVGPYVRLELGQERAFFIDSGALSHAFVPCGHVTTKRTAESVLFVVILYICMGVG